MKRVVVLTCVFFLMGALGAIAEEREPLNDGEPHGDPPYLIEDGWTPLLNGKDVSGWHASWEPKLPGIEVPAQYKNLKQGGWFTTRGVKWERLLGPTLLTGRDEPGATIINGNGRAGHLITDKKHGDVELYLEFMLAKGSNSGVYLQSLYEVQVFDSWGSEFPVKSSDCGGIYHRWIDGKAVGGSAPKVNASRRPGQWQSYHIWFQAPRFDRSGKKTSNAKFMRVLHNGQLVQENVEVEGGTRAHMPIDEAALNSLRLQGDHGPVAYRNIHWRPLRPIVRR